MSGVARIILAGMRRRDPSSSSGTHGADPTYGFGSCNVGTVGTETEADFVFLSST
eukprot:CAMPEP_0204631562 /NCGR_PEP_ID=MMETSP0717-20131115/22974_1 /ASSEMBLY_ACC=CAM_ASM_000666 /TAXON_ID=230516 /ORGANISM="Chaetoceros curvisetus" /LENGTH=54 /DNA_ID=CAMNT_0051649151 /DNA_START=86 /DNA_END=246 /DNA_ORIENTATION=-